MKLIVVSANSWFRHKTTLKIIWVVNSGRSSEETGHFMVSKGFKSTIKDVRVKHGSYTGSDYKMVIGKICLKMQSFKKRQRLSNT